MIYLVILVFVTPSLSQYQQYIGTGPKPDVTFGDHNDRFDVTKFLRQQQRLYYKNEALDAQSEEFRRYGKYKNKYKSNKINDERKTKRYNNADTSETKTLVNFFGTGRSNTKMRKKVVRKLEDHVNELANSIILKMKNLRRNYDDDFAYHDNMNSEGGNLDDYNANLKRIGAGLQNLRKDDVEVSSRRLQDIVDELHRSKPTRRISSDPEKEILLHYAFPLDVKIEGFLQKPLEDTLQ